MKGLLYKDLFLAFRYYKNYFLLVSVFLIASWFDRENLFFAFYPCIVSGLITMSLIAVDEADKWNMTCGFLPFTKKQLVGAKYLTGLILVGIFFALTMSVQIAQMLVQDNGIQVDALSAIGGMLLTFGLATPGIMLPFIYKFGVEKGRMSYILVIGGTAGIVAFLSTSERFVNFGGDIPVTVLALGSLAIYGLSFLISVKVSSFGK